jgi:hypothetical protein
MHGTRKEVQGSGKLDVGEVENGSKAGSADTQSPGIGGLRVHCRENIAERFGRDTAFGSPIRRISWVDTVRARQVEKVARTCGPANPLNPVSKVIRRAEGFSRHDAMMTNETELRLAIRQTQTLRCPKFAPL